MSQTFHESYGLIDRSTFRLIKKFNVSPADWYMIELHMDYFPTIKSLNDHIKEMSLYHGGSYYCPPEYWTEV